MSSAAVGPRSPGIVATVGRNWTRVLVTLLGVFELSIALSAGPLVTLVVGAVSGVVLMVTPWLTGRLPTATLVVLLIVATVPFAALSWWTVVVPLLAVVALAVGLPLVARRTADTAPRGAGAVRNPAPEQVGTR